MTNRPSSHIQLHNIRGWLFFAIDINNLVAEHQASSMVKLRVSHDWMNIIKIATQQAKEFGFDKPRHTESQYAKTERRARSTFSARHAKDFLPLELRFTAPHYSSIDQLTYSPEAVSITPQGAISCRIHVTGSAEKPITAKDFVYTYHRIQHAALGTVTDMISQFIKLWNYSSSASVIELTKPSSYTISSLMRSYDIWDYDFDLSCGGKNKPLTTIKGLFDKSDQRPVRELAAIANMDVSDVETLRDVRVDTFTKTDIGTRDDELWSIGLERMTRRHPERKETSNVAFFEDVRLATEIMLGYQCTAEVLDEWISEQRRDLLDKIISISSLDSASLTKLQKSYTDVVRASRMLVEPLVLERGVKHTFFKQVLTSLTSHFDLTKNVAQSRQSMYEFAGLVESISGFQYAQLNASLGDVQTSLVKVQVQFAKTSRTIGRLSLIIAIIGIIIASMQIIGPYLPNNKNISNNKGLPNDTQAEQNSTQP